MLSLRLLVNSRLLELSFQGFKSYIWIFNCTRGQCPTAVFFKSQLYLDLCFAFPPLGECAVCEGKLFVWFTAVLQHLQLLTTYKHLTNYFQLWLTHYKVLYIKYFFLQCFAGIPAFWRKRYLNKTGFQKVLRLPISDTNIPSKGQLQEIIDYCSQPLHL